MMMIKSIKQEPVREIVTQNASFIFNVVIPKFYIIHRVALVYIKFLSMKMSKKGSEKMTVHTLALLTSISLSLSYFGVWIQLS